MRPKSVVTLVFLIFSGLLLPGQGYWISQVQVLSPVESAALSSARRLAGQDEMAVFKGNECVWCHSKLSSPLKQTSRYSEWHISTHKLSGVGCDKCHGGNPREMDQNRAHAGILPASNPASRLHPQNLSATCQQCHQPYVAAFVESRHYQTLKGAKLGPSCNTCHAHMASEVIYTPEQTAQLCATCHDSASSGLPRQPELGGRASETMQAIRRASMMVAWADRLVEELDKRKLEGTADKAEMKEVRAQLGEAKASFHTFATAAARQKADAAYERGTRLKDRLRQRLYPNN